MQACWIIWAWFEGSCTWSPIFPSHPAWVVSGDFCTLGNPRVSSWWHPTSECWTYSPATDESVLSSLTAATKHNAKQLSLYYVYCCNKSEHETPGNNNNVIKFNKRLTSDESFSYSSINLSFSWLIFNTFAILLAAVSACPAKCKLTGVKYI